jgi:hypothetical protein
LVTGADRLRRRPAQRPGIFSIDTNGSNNSMPDLSNVSWLWVIIATLVYFGIGWLWYGKLFGVTWSAGMGFDADAEMSPDPMSFAKTLLSYFLICTGLAAAGAGIQAAFWLWLVYVAASSFSNSAWDPRPISVWGINVSYHLVGMIVATMILNQGLVM